ncbi:MAG TPA: methyltransferase domain-containing protein [Lentimicrobium sp.]|nr:methyltransferase domain-containing protein [Lentimicrobium sp.]
MNENTYPVNRWTDKDVERHWDNVASIYISENNKVKSAHNQRFIESIKHLSLFEACRILNVSSRDGEANDYITESQPDALITNAEISEGLIKVAHTIRPAINQVKIESYSRLPFKDGEFDRILSLETLEHVSQPLSFLQELYRVSTDDAILVLSCPPATSEIPYRIFTYLFGGHGEGPHKFLASKTVKSLLRETGWNLKLHKGTVLLPVGPERLQVLAENFINRFQGTFISELGIRQFFVCTK